MGKTHVQLAQEIERLENQILSLDDIQTNKPDVIIKTIAGPEMVINEGHEQLCIALRAFLEMILDKKKDEVRDLLNDSPPVLPTKKKSE